jgi:hypothetical protein
MLQNVSKDSSLVSTIMNTGGSKRGEEFLDYLLHYWLPNYSAPGSWIRVTTHFMFCAGKELTSQSRKACIHVFKFIERDAMKQSEKFRPPSLTIEPQE